MKSIKNKIRRIWRKVSDGIDEEIGNHTNDEVCVVDREVYLGVLFGVLNNVASQSICFKILENLSTQTGNNK